MPSRFAPGAALRRCTAVPATTFASDVWGRSASLSLADELPEGAFDDLLALTDVDRLVSLQGLRTPFLTVAKDGETVAAARFTGGGGIGATIGDQVADDQVTRLFAGGSTIVLQALHRTHAPLVDFGQALAADLGHPVQINAYITPAASQGFSDHYDVHDVFVLQVVGEKRWIVRSPVLVHPLRDQPWTDRRGDVAAAAKGEPLLDVVLRPGDALYLPRGFIHAATALGDTSAHLTVGIQQWTRKHLLDQIVASMSDLAEVRAPLPLGVDVTDQASLAPEVAATVAAVRAALDRRTGGPAAVTTDDVARRMRAQARAATRAEPVGPMAQARSIAELAAGTPLRLRRGLRALVEHTGHESRLTTSEVSVTVPGAAPDAMDRLLVGDVVTAAELADDGGLHSAHLLLRHAVAVRA